MEFKTITERKLSAKHYGPPERPLLSAKRFLLPAGMPWGQSLLMAEAQAGQEEAHQHSPGDKTTRR